MKSCLSILVIIASLAVGCGGSPEARKRRSLERAKHYMAAKDFRRAILEFKNAAQSDPHDAELQYQIGVVYLEMSDVPSAAQAFQRAVGIDAKHAGAQIKLAELYSAGRDQESVKDAKSRMETLLSTSPTDSNALTTLGFAELRLGQFQDAEKHLTAAAEHAPAHVKTALGLAQLRVGQKTCAEAEAALRKATEQKPPLATPHIILGEFYVRLKRFEEAHREFHRALEIEKDNAIALLDLGNLQLKTGAATEAETTFKQLSSGREPRYKTVYAVFLIQIGQLDRAVEEFRILYSADPQNRDVRRQLIAAYVLAGRRADVDSLLTAALKKNPKDTDALLHRARVQIANRKYTDAEISLHQVIEFEPNSGHAHYLLAAIQGRRGNGTVQRQELSEAVRLNPEFLAARLQLARLLITSKAAPSALAILNEAPDWQKERVEVVAEKNRALFATGDREQIKKGIKEGLEISRTAELLMQDAVIKFGERDIAAARASINEILKNFPEETRALDLVLKISRAEGMRVIREHVALHPKSARLQQYLGEQLGLDGKLREARAVFETARTLDSSFWPAVISLADVSVKEQRFDEARSLVMPLVSHADAGVSAHRLLARIEVESGNRIAAVEHFRKISEAAPNDVIAMNNLAYALAEYANLFDEALKIAQHAKELAPNHAAVDDTLGWVFYKKGLYNSAVQHLENSVKRQPSAERRVHLALAYARMGEVNRGFEQLTEAMKLNPRLPELIDAQKMLISNR